MEFLNIDEHIINLKENGYTIIRNAFEKQLADTIVQDFDDWCKTQPDFKNFTLCRVVEFHTHNKNTLELVTNKYVNEIITNFFNKEQVIYSSLTFREGTAQHLHRDTPHFYTNPINQYCGVWYALEDIKKKAGPLKYYKNSHLIDDPNHHEIYNTVFNKNLSYAENNLNALIHYNKIIEDKSIDLNLELFDENNFEMINKGDVIIWNPRLLHGGSDIIDKTLTRYSMVTHNIPINTAVFNASHFFTEKPTQEYLDNKCLYTYLSYNNVKYINRGDSKAQVQKTYL